MVITGVSGSGKSSLAFDTIFAEGQRRYVESLSQYARQFLPQVEKPDVDAIEGLSPAIAIDQKTAVANPRSTVGTVTEIYDYLRLLFSSIGVPHCPSCGREVRAQSVGQMVDRLLSWKEGTRVILLAPLALGRKGSFREELEGLARQGFVRARIDGELVELGPSLPRLERQRRHRIEIVVDRVVVRPGSERRLSESLEVAVRIGKGLVVVAPEGGLEEIWSQHHACVECGTGIPELSPRLFSFNSPLGACPSCDGLGAVWRVDPARLVVDPARSLLDGALVGSPESLGFGRGRELQARAQELGIPLDRPWRLLPSSVQEKVLWGSSSTQGSESHRGFEGLASRLERQFRESDSKLERRSLEQFLVREACPACHGKRLRAEARSVTVQGWSIDALAGLPLEELRRVLLTLELSNRERQVAGKVLEALQERLRFLIEVGVGYLTLDRPANSLSGGESQRLRLATQVGSELTGVLYVLDEPSIGLHPRDQERLLRTLERLRESGNTVLVVEHDEATIRAADWVIDLGPGAGRHGGKVIAAGPPRKILRDRRSLTGQYLRGERLVRPERALRRSGQGQVLRVVGARQHNLKNLTVEIPLGCLVAVTGVSGSGKSSLVEDVIGRALARHYHGAKEPPGDFDRLEGLESIDKVVLVDQSPIGRSPRSNPATYTGCFDHIRRLLAMTSAARARGFSPSRFSFNVPGGRCETCRGEGQIKVAMHLLPDLWVPCEDCGGKRYQRETLEVRYQDRNIADILELTVEQALEVFRRIPPLERMLQTLVEVGLGYLHLGQPATQLSGGEAQRVKLATELARRSQGRTLYLLDEPTTGLHFEDVSRLLELLDRLVDRGDTVLVVEHHLDVIAAADWVIDLGPEGGNAGGYLVATGPPEAIAACLKSHTGRALAAHWKLRSQTQSRARRAAASSRIGTHGNPELS